MAKRYPKGPALRALYGRRKALVPFDLADSIVDMLRRLPVQASARRKAKLLGEALVEFAEGPRAPEPRAPRHP